MENLKKRIQERNPSLLKKKHRDYINRISEGDFHLSHTSLVEFSESPLSFLKYKVGDKKDSSAMKEGRLVHSLILQPEKFDDNYILIEKKLKESTWAKKENAEHKKELKKRAEEEGKELVTLEELENALEFKDTVLGNKFAGDLIRSCNSFEMDVRWEYYGYKWRGFIDAVDTSWSIDCKKVRDARPQKLKWQAINRKFAWQAFHYNVALDVDFYRDFYFVCYDNSLRVSVLKIDFEQLRIAHHEIDNQIKKFKECVLWDNWDQSLEYNSLDGYFELY